jgi:hypothetical protein
MRFFSVHPLPIKICHLNRSRLYAEKAVYCLITMRGDQLSTRHRSDQLDWGGDHVIIPVSDAVSLTFAPGFVIACSIA